MRFFMCRVLRISVITILIANSVVIAADWPNWRGPNYDGKSAEKGFIKTWVEAPKVLWEHPIGSGFSSFTAVGGKVYTCGTKDKQQVLFCFDADTGRVVWEKAFEKELKDRQGGDGTRGTPTVHQGRVYQLGGHGTLACLNADNGEEIWKKKLGKKPRWGYSGSVLIEKQLAIIPDNGKDGALLALDKKTGDMVWECANDKIGYSTPYPFTFGKKRYIFCFLAKAGIIADAKTGREVCRIPWETAYDVNASTPIFHDGYLFLSSGYNTGCALFKLDNEGDKLSAKEVWRSQVLMTKFRSCLLKDGVLYSGDQQGLHCVDFMTGKKLWGKDRMRHSSVVLADDHLIVLTEKGRLMIAKARPEEFKPIAEADVLSGRCWTVPMLYEGKLYLRNLKKAICLDLRPQKVAAR
ncbi:MAG: PQQ-binding-like beta-propeller repeat protein [Planctomycetota bacterium]|nr:MAG: PQQ-binding-like beta-propeller repeat protein [Planctomycetota bacterium]